MKRPRIRRLLTLTQEHVNRAFRIASWYGRLVRRAEISDLESAALEGLAKAARDWNPHYQRRNRSRGEIKLSFWSFAFTRILGEMRDELRRLDHLTRTQRAKVVEGERGGKSFADPELKWVVPHEPISLDAPLAEAEEPHSDIERFELQDALQRASADLTDRARLVLFMRELKGYRNHDLAQVLGVTEARASQLWGDALEQMREQLGDSLTDAA
jgi:RNA polymerase sigma factor (sigma-70 family)